MTQIKNFMIASMIALGMTSQAQAGLLLEPYLGYNFMGEIESGGAKSDTTGVGYGARVAYTSLGFMAGADFQLRSLTYDKTGFKDTANQDIGLFVGYEFPVLLRVWGTYFLDSSVKPSGAAKATGNGFKLGVGYTAMPLVSINLELISNTYDKQGSTTLNPEVELQTYMLSVSVPFGI